MRIGTCLVLGPFVTRVQFSCPRLLAVNVWINLALCQPKAGHSTPQEKMKVGQRREAAVPQKESVSMINKRQKVI